MKNNEIMGNVIAFLGGALLLALIFTAAILTDSFIIMKFWNWFLFTQFDLSRIGLTQGIALSLMVSLLYARLRSGSKEDSDFLNGYLARAILLFLGWIVYLIM